MIKLLFGSKKLFIRQSSDLSNDSNNNNISRKIEEENLIENNALNVPLNKENNQKKNNYTVEIKKHFSPAALRTPILLPKIKNNFKKENSQKKFNFSKVNSSSNSFGIPPPEIKKLKKDGTQVSVLENVNIKNYKNSEKNEKQQNNRNNNNNNLSNNNNSINHNTNNNNVNLSNNNINSNNNNNNFQQINNITNISIHIYSNNINQTDDNLKNEMIKSKLNNKKKHCPIGSSSSTNSINTLNLRPSPNSTINNINDLNNISTMNKMKSNKSSIFSYKNKTNSKKNNIKLIYANPFNNMSFDKDNCNNNNKSFFNFNNKLNTKNKDMNNNNIKELKLKKFLSNSLPNINIKNNSKIITNNNNKSSLDITEDKNINNSIENNNNNSGVNLNDVSEIKKHNENLELNSFNTSMNFLRDLTGDTAKFILFLKLMQIYMDIAILLDNNENVKGNFRKKTTTILNMEVTFKLNTLLNNYFNILSAIYNDKIINYLNLSKNIENNNNEKNNQIQNGITLDCFFLFPTLNNIFHKIIKMQICLFSAILVTLSQLGPYELNNIIKSCFNKIIKKTTSSLLNLYEFFIKEDLNLNYPDLIKNNLRQDFNDQINRLFKAKKKSLKNSEILSIISKNINMLVESMRNYALINLKYSLIKPFGDSINQMISTIDKKSLYQFVTVFLKTILFGELEINKKKVIQNSLNFKSKYNNLKQINKNNYNYIINYSGSSFMNNIQETPPYLPPKNPKYKYTLVLDMDETLLHFFFTQVNGMFFVRPYCFEFLNDLNNLYEIITFTAGTKDYADNILNQLDINDNIIKYRLYRQHTTITGFSPYKDLNNLGRDLSKIIIVDNLKENFKMQPNNGIYIKTWTNDVNDTQLKDLLKILKDIVIYSVEDVRPIIQKMNEDIKASGNMINPYANINIPKILCYVSKRKKCSMEVIKEE